MSKRPEVAIVGGGPAGLTAAVILEKHGFPVQVYERDASQLQRTQGGSLDLHEDGGQEALKRAGLLDGFNAIARHEDQESRDVDFRTGARLEEGFPQDDEGNRPEIDRGVLRDLLLSALPASRIHWNKSLQSVDVGEPHHQLVFADGSTVTADIVIGADGGWSHVRQALSAVPLEYSGVTFIEGWLNAPSALQVDFVGNGTLFSFGGPEAIIAQKNGLGRICLYAAVRRSRDWLKARTERQDLRDIVRTTYAHWGPPLRDLVASCDSFVERPIYQLPLGFTWEHHDGVLLVGDAAHLMPPLGVGVNLAMLDASDIAMAIIAGGDWRQTTRAAQGVLCQRAAVEMDRIIPGFRQWFPD